MKCIGEGEHLPKERYYQAKGLCTDGTLEKPVETDGGRRGKVDTHQSLRQKDRGSGYMKLGFIFGPVFSCARILVDHRFFIFQSFLTTKNKKERKQNVGNGNKY